jgi:sulfite dehydrogenase (quinone) subunit SoeA
VWTWNAIGKRSGTWGLSKDAPESTQGFLLNHLINELLPEQGGGYRFSNSDPITGQAAWYDLRVRIEKCGDGIFETSPQFEPIASPVHTASRLHASGGHLDPRSSGQPVTP